jgi:hypothetical protein
MRGLVQDELPVKVFQMTSTPRPAPTTPGLFAARTGLATAARSEAFDRQRCKITAARSGVWRSGEPGSFTLTGSRRLPYGEPRRFPSGIKRECGEDFCESDSAAAPATVSGEPSTISHWTSRSGKAVTGIDPRARRPAASRGHTRSALGGVSWWVSSRIRCECGSSSFAVTCHVTASRS